ncbi:pyruvate kinase [Paludibacterium yongneupense]|uniref:pyruvate kinase n=1 Tax=Paludibacterium yongneupense TaxID=400061 RepID=UPI0005674DAA|nr:pyruvate kinase [Paludibacterium yongneupense]
MNAHRSTRAGNAEFLELIAELERLVAASEAIESEFQRELDAVHPSQYESARNLLHYLAMRRIDLRSTQHRLARLGLSSLGRIEAHVQATLVSVLQALCRMARQPLSRCRLPRDPLDFERGGELLSLHAASVLGAPPAGRRTRIMVTAPSQLADEGDLLPRLLASGMNILRINGAHDTPQAWQRMAERLRSLDPDGSCLLSFDLAGPKLRTGPAAKREGVVRFKPLRDARRRVLQAAAVRLVWEGEAVARDVPLSCPLPARVGDRIRLIDFRGKARELSVVDVESGACLCHARASVHLAAGLTLTLMRAGEVVAAAKVAGLPAVECSLLLHPGDLLDIVPGEMPARPALDAGDGGTPTPACVSCGLTELFAQAAVGARVYFDDGKIGATVLDVAPDRLRVRVDHIAGGHAHLGGGKGINLPGSALRLPALTAADLAALEQVAGRVDLVALSFVQTARDVHHLRAALERQAATRVGIILKIETRQAFENLPELLLAVLCHPRVAVMVARGDLGVELGFERLAEVQEEILWLCEAAHIPVIWATQVLETLAKTGAPSRAEITDAAMGGQAECVMLNKGPYIDRAVRFLSGVLARTEAHHDKKSSMLRRLGVSATRG